MKILIADRQEITRAGLMYVIGRIEEAQHQYVDDKAELVAALKEQAHAVVVLDYTLFDINDASELLILSQRFATVRWILFSDELSQDFVRIILAGSNRFSVVLKDSSLQELREAVHYASRDRQYICQHVTQMLLMPRSQSEERVRLTKTETEVLKDIALGLTTKEIAEKRFSSFHTINTHRKNIFRKLQVNNIHEATKYALRAGLIDSADYYI